MPACVVVSNMLGPPTKKVRDSYPLALFATPRHRSGWRGGPERHKQKRPVGEQENRPAASKVMFIAKLSAAKT